MMYTHDWAKQRLQKHLTLHCQITPFNIVYKCIYKKISKDLNIIPDKRVRHSDLTVTAIFSDLLS